MSLAEAIMQFSFLEMFSALRSLNCSSPAVSTTSFHLTSGGCCADTLCLINLTRVRVMLPFRRLSMVPLPYHWMLLRRPHPALRLNMSLRRWVLAQLPRFLLIRPSS